MDDKTYEDVLTPLKEKRGFYIFLFLSEFSLEAVGCGNTNGICLGGSIKIPGKGMNYRPLWFWIRSILFPRGNLVASALTLLDWKGPWAEEPEWPSCRSTPRGAPRSPDCGQLSGPGSQYQGWETLSRELQGEGREIVGRLRAVREEKQQPGQVFSSCSRWPRGRERPPSRVGQTEVLRSSSERLRKLLHGVFSADSWLVKTHYSSRFWSQMWASACLGKLKEMVRKASFWGSLHGLASLVCKVKARCYLLSHVRLFATRGLQPARLLCPSNSPGKSSGVGCHSLLQGMFPTQGLSPVSCFARGLFIVWAARPCIHRPI